MAVVTPTIQNQVTELYLGFFGRAPDAAGFGYWSEKIANGTATVTGIANAFATTPEFVSNYGGLTPDQQVTKIYNNVLNRAPDTAGLAYWTAQLNAGTSIGSVVWNIVNAAFSQVGTADGLLVQNKVTVGEYFAITLASNDTASAATAYNLVTSNPASIAQAEATLATTTYTLTTGIDVVNGANGNDIINGVVVTGTAASTTLNVFDSINGGAGVNTLNVNYAGTTATFAAAAIPTLNNIQIVNLSGLNGAAANTMDGSIAPQLTTLNVSAPIAAAGAGSFTLNNGSAATTTFGLSSIARDDFDVTYNSASGVFAGTADAVALNLNTVGGASPQTSTDGPAVAFIGAASGQGVETINVAATGASRLASLTATDSVTQTVTAVNVSGAGSLRVDGTMNFKGTAGTINASTNTGGVTFTVGTEDITFTGGAGNDRLNFATAGDLTAADSISFGAGVNTLGLADTTISTSLYSLINATNAERVAFTAGITADMSKLTAAVVVVDNNVAGNTFTKLAATDLVEVSTAAANTATVDLTASLGYNTANVKLAGTSTGRVDLAGITTTNQTIVNIESVGTSGTVNDIGGVTNTANTTITVTGSGTGLTMGTLAASAVLNATAYTGSTFSVTGANAASSFTTGSAVDTITLSTVAGGDIVNAGAGDDIINGALLTGTTATTITGGLGADTINLATNVAGGKTTLNVTAAESYATALKSDTVVFADMAAGKTDVITLNTGLLSTSLAAATTVTIGTTTVAQAGGFLWVNTSGTTAAATQDAILYQDSNANGVIDATDLMVTFDLDQTGTDTFAIALVGSQATVTFTGV